MSNLVGKRAKIIDTDGVGGGKQLLNATGVIKSIVDNNAGILCYLTLDEPWSLHRETCSTFDYRLEIIEDEKPIKEDENPVGKRAKLINISDLSWSLKPTEDFLNATGTIVSFQEDNGYGGVYDFELDEPWATLSLERSNDKIRRCFVDKFEFIEDNEVAEPKEFDNFKLLTISTQFQLLSLEAQQIFRKREMP